ncbi:MAG: hypothetical protein WC700_07650 [Gemmatimonadaceae bacterium]
MQYDPSKPLYTVKVTTSYNEEAFAEDKSHSWALGFEVEFQMGVAFDFTVEEPYLVGDKLRQMAAGEDVYIRCYQGNGEGSVQLRDGKITFRAAPSGAGGDVASRFTVPAADVLPELRKAFDYIDDKFYSKPE